MSDFGDFGFDWGLWEDQPIDLSPLPDYSGTTVDPYIPIDPSTFDLTQGDLGIGSSGGIENGGGYVTGLQKLYDSDPNFAGMIGQLAKALGLTDAKGALNLLPLLAAGGLIGGGINSSNATKEASAQLQQAAKDANDQAQALIGPARDAFNPFIINGTAANGELLALARAPGLAGNFAPVKSYGFTAPKGTVTLADLVKAK